MMKPSLSPLLLAALLAPALRAQTPAPATAMATPAVVPTNPALQSPPAHSTAPPTRNGEALPSGSAGPMVQNNEALHSGQAVSNEALRSSQPQPPAVATNPVAPHGPSAQQAQALQFNGRAGATPAAVTNEALHSGSAGPMVQNNEALHSGQAAPAAPAIPTSAELPFGTLADRIRAAQHRQAESAAHNVAVLESGAVPMLNQASDRLLEGLAAAKTENPVVSGPGVALLLQQVADGARGPSQTEIQRWLAVKNQPPARLEGLLAQQDSALQQAGALLIPRPEAVAPDYRAGLERAGFVLAADVAELNQRVAALSHQQIPRLLERLDPGVSLVLVHGLHFAAPWAEPFDPARTQPRPFRPLQGSKITVPMMEKTLNLRRLDDRHARLQAVALPFAGDYVLLLARPDQPSAASLRDAGRWLSQHQAELLNAEPRPLKLGLPRWQLRRENPLVATLQAEGIRTVFGLKADLDGIGPDLRVGDVRQTLSLSIDERGGRADVATVAEIVPRSASLAPPPELWLDRPFVYALVAQSNGLTLLKGQLHRPVGVQP